MGGTGSGGRRHGSGPKRKSRKEHWLSGNAAHRSLSLVPRSDLGTPTPGPEPEPDTDRLTEREAVWWRRLVPAAHRLGTLTPDRLAGMELLCQVAAAQEQAEAGTRKWLDLTRLLSQHLDRFGLTGNGKVPVGAVAADDEEGALAQLLAVK